MTEKAEQESPYRQFFQGQDLSFTLHTLNPDGSVRLLDRQITIAAIKDGGFFGKVLIPANGDFVIKTSVPDPWHDLWRRINWNFRDFPSQVNETQAKLDHLATNLIHGVIPILTEGQFYSPRSLGYTKLPNGYAQVLERVRGRGPRFDKPDDEFTKFRSIQSELTNIGFSLGLEHAAQIHPDNPFGLANLWLDEKNKGWVWLDTLPAIPHRGWIWPAFYFRFHKDIRHWFYPQTHELTFNKIHIDTFLEEIQKSRHLFDEQTYQQVLDNLNLYQQLWEEKQSQGETPRNLRAVVGAALESGKVVPKVVLDLGRGIQTTIQSIFNSKLRRVLVNNLVLAGTKRAHEEGIIDDEECQQELTLVEQNSQTNSKRMLPVLTGVYGYYQGSNWLLLKPTEVISYAYLFGTDLTDRLVELDLTPLITQENAIEKLAIFGSTFLGFRVVGALNTYVSTKLLGKLFGMNLETAARVSVIPAIGSHLAIPAQIGVTAGSRNELLWHYSVRNLVAKASSLHPAGGWGTQYEGQLWKLVGHHLEGLARSKNS